jgi:hypothetical protein
MIVRSSAFLLLGFLVPACPPHAVSPSPDASDAGYQVTIIATDAPYDYDQDAQKPPCQRACDNLAAMGCPEGANLGCVQACSHAQLSGVFDIKPECIAAANTPNMVRQCGTVRCTGR